MIELYSENNTNYTKNGNVVLMPTECIAKAEIGGQWNLKLIHPIDEGGRWTFLSEEAVIKAPAYNGAQLWRIRHREKDDFEVAVECEPIFFDSMQDCFLVDVRPTNKTGTQALALMLTNNKYNAVSDITATSTAYYEYKNLMEALQGNDDNAFVKRWGGELAFDNFTVRAMTALGADLGVRVFYGKNIEAIKETVDMTDVITRIYPVGYNGRRYSNGYVDSPIIGVYPTVKTASREYRNIMLASDAPESAADDPANIICQNQAALNTALAAAVNAEYSAGLDKPAVTLDVDMVDLRNAEEYKDYIDLESVSLGDTVHLYHSRLGITSTERVIAIEYDSITESVRKITLGVKQYDFFNQITGNLTTLNRTTQANEGIGAAVDNAQSTANNAQTNLDNLSNALGSMAYQDAQGYPMTYKSMIYDAILSAWDDYVFSHTYGINSSQLSADSWHNFTTDNPSWSADDLDSGIYLIILSVTISASADGMFSVRLWNNNAELDSTTYTDRASVPTSATATRATANLAMVWDSAGGNFNGWAQIYSSVSVTPVAAKITLIRIGG